MHCGPCGKTPVPYPMSSGPNCGDQAYKIKCDQNTSTLHFISKPGRLYPITSIDTRSQRLVIRPPSVLPGTCFSEDFSSKGFHMDDSILFNISSSNTILLFNCTDNMLHLQVPINCSSNCPCHTYIDNTRYVNFDPGLPFAKWPAPGLELLYVSPLKPTCNTKSDCRELPFSTCLADPTDGGRRRCFCKKGRYWDPATGYCQKCRHGTGCKIHTNQYHTPAIGATAGIFLVLLLTTFLVYRQRQYTKNVARKALIKERENILNSNNSGKSGKRAMTSLKKTCSTVVDSERFSRVP
ncbi:hypothetical protein SASPL_105430 [Salvia splendens]|uniref:Wall-associated receptor kinase galacturonan-binding domain-containing protein n=1 Tax=Salvia splendens TaxID=180675 RepID=A0A8X9A9Z4_SALSN|nr:hypothetical protein SASPL_105430 [Salvia splendens]